MINLLGKAKVEHFEIGLNDISLRVRRKNYVSLINFVMDGWHYNTTLNRTLVPLNNGANLRQIKFWSRFIVVIKWGHLSVEYPPVL